MHECSYISLRENASKDTISLDASSDQAYAERSLDRDIEHRKAEVYRYYINIDILSPAVIFYLLLDAFITIFLCYLFHFLNKNSRKLDILLDFQLLIEIILNC